MPLHYLWIREFKNIRQQGFAFTDEYTIQYSADTHQLTIEPYRAFIPGFFGGNITSVTGVIGENGVGKTNLLEFIKLRLSSFENGSFTAFEYGVECIVVANSVIYIHNEIEVSNVEGLARLGFTIRYFKLSLGLTAPSREEVDKGRLPFDSPLEHFRYIYYSNIFDLQHHYDDGAIDISTNALMYSDSHSLRYRRFSDRDNIPVDLLAHFQVEEIRRQLTYLVDHGLGQLPIAMPNDLSFTIEDDENNFLRIKWDWYDQHNFTELRRLHGYFFNDRQADQTLEQHYVQEFARHFRLKLLQVLAYHDTERFRSIYPFHYDIVDRAAVDNAPDNPYLTQVLDVIHQFDDIIFSSEMPTSSFSTDKTSDVGKMYNTIHYPITDDHLGKALAFLRNYDSLTRSKGFLSFYWKGFSSGQLNMFTLYARLWTARLHHTIQQGNHLVLLIDEGETYFHPTWQKAFVSRLLAFLKKTFSQHPVQVILTSNSPFIASDLPKSKINFVARDAEGFPQVTSGLDWTEETFASNIHTLYADAFFMKGSLVGDFAESIVNQLLRTLNREPKTDWLSEDPKVLQQYVNLIGEPVLRLLAQQQLNRLNASNDTNNR